MGEELFAVKFEGKWRVAYKDEWEDMGWVWVDKNHNTYVCELHHEDHSIPVDTSFVKQLNWTVVFNPKDFTIWQADGVIFYQIRRVEKTYFADRTDAPNQGFYSLEAAQAFIQKDYEKRIYSAFQTPHKAKTTA